MSGTSMASPHVAGTAALVWAANPTWSNDDVRYQLQNTAEDLGLLSTEQGYGLVDAAKAVGVDTDTTPPAKVTGLTVTTISCIQLDLAWDANAEGDLDNYNVYRSTTSSSSYNLVASPTTNSYSDDGLTASKTYFYKVSAVNVSENEGETSDETSGTTSADDLNPATSNVVADPNPTNGANSVTLTAVVSDETTGNSNIAAAECKVGADGTGTPMSASDGAFDSPTEEVMASIDVSGWDIGQYTLYVHGNDAAGNWGTTESVVLDVTEASSDTMHVDSIDMSLKIRGPWVNAIAIVTIVDENGASVEGATVSGKWSEATTDSDSGITKTNGQVSLKSDKVKKPDSGTTFTFTVDNVTKDGWTYDPSGQTSNSKMY
jgi:subtilisin